MRYGRYCIAGIDIYDKNHYRPKFFKVFGGIKGDCLEENGGPFSLRNIIDISQTKPKPEGAQSENVLFKIENVKVIRKLSYVEFWDWLSEVSNDSIDFLIPDLIKENLKGFVNEGHGKKSLGVLKPRKVSIAGGPEKLRIGISDINGDFDLPVTDYRFFDADNSFKPRYRLFKDLIHECEDCEVLLSIGLGSLWEDFYGRRRYWLQVNNIFLERPLDQQE